MHFEVLGEITDVKVIAIGRRIRELARLRRRYGEGRWRKLKGSALIRTASGRVGLAELHWYEAHGVGKKELKRKRWLE
jgi:hypothetical protein